MRRPLRILCIGGHPADTFDGAGGTLAHHVQDGDLVTVVALTAGTRIHDVVVSDTLRFQERIPDAADLTKLMAERAAVKEDEVRRACACLGITDVRFFGYDDAVLTLREELILRMARTHPRDPARRRRDQSPERARRVREPSCDDRAARPQRDRRGTRRRDGRSQSAPPGGPGLLHDARARPALERAGGTAATGIRM